MLVTDMAPLYTTYVHKWSQNVNRDFIAEDLQLFGPDPPPGGEKKYARKRQQTRIMF